MLCGSCVGVRVCGVFRFGRGVGMVAFYFYRCDCESVFSGSGIAVLSFACKAAEHGAVAIVTKRARAESNTAWAQGGVACVTSGEDSFALHIQDTHAAGAYLCARPGGGP